MFFNQCESFHVFSLNDYFDMTFTHKRFFTSVIPFIVGGPCEIDTVQDIHFQKSEKYKKRVSLELYQLLFYLALCAYFSIVLPQYAQEFGFTPISVLLCIFNFS